MVGPSGCGKTTTLRMIAGFERPTSGRIVLDGVDVAQMPPHKRNVNTVFQSYALFPHLDVAGNVAFGLKYKRLTKEESRKRVAEALYARAARRLRAAQAGPAVRRPAAAGRARTRARPDAAGAAARRAARRARRPAAQGPPGRAEGAAGRARDHLRLRHARPGGGADDERSRGRDERRPRRAGGHAARDLRGAARRCSSPTSSASRTCSSAEASADGGRAASLRVGERTLRAAAGATERAAT